MYNYIYSHANHLVKSSGPSTEMKWIGTGRNQLRKKHMPYLDTYQSQLPEWTLWIGPKRAVIGELLFSKVRGLLVGINKASGTKTVIKYCMTI